MEEKIFCGKGKKGNYSTKLNICLSDIPKEHITESKGKSYVRLELKERKEPDQYGNSHFVTVDTWKPNGQGSPKSENPERSPANPPYDDSNLPF